MLNRKGNVRAAPHRADYLHNRPRNIRTVLLHSDSKGQKFESSRARQLAEIRSFLFLALTANRGSHWPYNLWELLVQKAGSYDVGEI